MDKMLESWNFIITKFNNYYIDSKYFFLFILCIILNFAIIKKDNKVQKNLVVYLPLVLFIFVFNPFVFNIVKPMADKGGVYWRFFWLFPLAPVISYAFTQLIVIKKENFGRCIIIISLIGILYCSGKLVYSSENYQKVNNFYKMPDDILNTIMIIGSQNVENKKCMIPTSVVAWVRQYDASINIEYNRSPHGGYGKFVNDFDNGKIKSYMQKYINDGCNFIVCKKKIEYDTNLEDYNFMKIGENDSYIIYMLNQ